MSKQERAPSATRHIFTVRRIRSGVWADVPEAPTFPSENLALEWARHNGPVLKPEKGDGFNIFRVAEPVE